MSTNSEISRLVPILLIGFKLSSFPLSSDDSTISLFFGLNTHIIGWIKNNDNFLSIDLLLTG
jgi:hypothetical protein